MKQHITGELANELTEEGKNRLREWWKQKDEIFNIFTSSVLALKGKR